MKLTPVTLEQVAPAVPKGRPRQKTAKMSVYSNGNIRFNKAAATLLNAPSRISIDLDEMTVAFDENGFLLSFFPAYREFVIANSRLGKYILKKFATKKIHFQISESLMLTLWEDTAKRLTI